MRLEARTAAGHAVLGYYARSIYRGDSFWTMVAVDDDSSFPDAVKAAWCKTYTLPETTVAMYPAGILALVALGEPVPSTFEEAMVGHELHHAQRHHTTRSGS